MKFFSKILVVCAFSVLLGSCYEDPNCIGLRNDIVGVTFRKMFDRKIDTLNVVGASINGLDGIFNFKDVNGPIYFPLNVSTNTQTFNFELGHGSFSMVTNYLSQPQFESEDCSPRFILSNLNVPQYDFDSVAVSNSTPLSVTQGSNIDIYRCPITNNIKIGFRQLFADDKKPNGDALADELTGASVSYLPFLYYPDTILSSLVLPLNRVTNTTSINFDFKNKGMATVNLQYDFESNTKFNACGSQDFIKDIQVTGSTGFDIARVTRDSIYDPPTTNVLLLRCPQTNFIELRLKSPSGEETKFDIDKVTASYTPQEFYVGVSTSVLILPLDISQDQTDFTIEFGSGPKQIIFGYTRTQKTFYEKCDQTLMTEVSVLSSDFTSTPVVKQDSIKFPTEVNFEIINN